MNDTKAMKFTKKKKHASPMRKAYIIKLIGRCLIFILCLILWFQNSEHFKILEGMNFFRKFSLFHILWVIWIVGMLGQLIPIKKYIPLGSQKLFRQRYLPVRGDFDHQMLRKYIVSATKSAYIIFIVWAVMIAILGGLYHIGIINEVILFLISVFFYVCDLICVLIWCPFRLFMRNRCCTTCRIFNWDHLMMFTPLLFVDSFFAKSLWIMAIVVWLFWEFCVMVYPERFWEHSNEALKCSSCTDKLCTQYCGKFK